VSTILLALALILYVARLRLEGNRSYVTVTGRASSMPRPPVPRGVTWACFVACLLLAGLILLVYGILVVSALVEAFPSNLALTLRHFAYMSAHARALQDTLVYGLGAAFLCAPLGVLLAVLVPGRGWPVARGGGV